MKQFLGTPAARGIAIGPVFQYRQLDLQIDRYIVEEPEREVERLDQAVSVAAKQVEEIYEKAKLEMAAEQAAIFEAQSMMLQDPELLSTIKRTIREKKLNAEFAVKEATEYYAALLENMEDEYFRLRVNDVRDISQRLQKLLLNVDDGGMKTLSCPSVIVARDLTPSDTVLFDKDKVLGFCTVEGGETSHTAILARGLGLPAVVGSDADVLIIPSGNLIILDGFSGNLIVDPADEILWAYQKKQHENTDLLEKAKSQSQEPAFTKDGFQVEVVANIGNIDGAKNALDYGAEGVGLLRTEFLFLERKDLPDEEEQYQAYSSILNVFGDLPVVLRTSDIGGDKELPYLDLPKELNPFLGVRGLRLALQRPEEILIPQLKASLRAAVGHNLRIMFPMVAVGSEIRQIRKIVGECQKELINQGFSLPENIQIGIMVEIPAAALMADVLAPEVDFFSIGTNDLTQYTLAVDRTNPQLSYLSSAFSPAVLRLIHTVIVQAHRFGKWVGLCGELAGEPLAIPILLGMNLDEFSMNPQSIPLAKQVIRTLRKSDCQSLVDEVLSLQSPEEVKGYIKEKFPEIALY